MRRAGRQKNRQSPSLFVNICFSGKITLLCSPAVPISRKPLSGSELVTFWNRGLRSSLFAFPPHNVHSVKLRPYELISDPQRSRLVGEVTRSDTSFRYGLPGSVGHFSWLRGRSSLSWGLFVADTMAFGRYYLFFLSSAAISSTRMRFPLHLL